MVDHPAKPHGVPRGKPRPDAPTRRAFVAVFPPEEVLARVADLRSRLEPDLPALRWVASRNVHFTLRFFGDLLPDAIARAASVLDAVASRTAPFSLTLEGLGVFPSWKRPRVLWVGASQGGEVLSALARELERGFREARLERADKPFVPHLTLGRWRDGVVPAPERAEAAVGRVGPVGSFAVDRVVLTESRLGPGGSTYTPLHAPALCG